MQTVPGRPNVWAIVVGAGSGARFGSAKQFATLGGERVLDRSRRIAAACCDGVVVVVPADATPAESAPVDSPVPVRVVPGGASRTASVRAGLAAVPADADVICVHDAARPLATPGLYERVVTAVLEGADAAVPGVPVADTIKVVDPAGTVTSTPARSSLVAVQTPQAFSASALRAAHAAAAADPAIDAAVTDDASLIEQQGGRVVVVAGESDNRKITHRDDLEWVRRRIAADRLEDSP